MTRHRKGVPMKSILVFAFCCGIFAGEGPLQAQRAATMVVGKNLTADLPVAAYSPTNPYSPHDIALASYTGPDYAPQYELLIHGVAAIENTSTQTGTIDILLVNSSPLCG